MAEETQSLIMSDTNCASKQLTVPADVQRELEVAIDDELEVEIYGVSDLIDQASFVGKQVAGDRITVPAPVARKLDLVAGEEYDIAFDTPEADEVPGAIPDEEVTDDEEIEEAIEDAESELEDAESELEDEEEDSPGLGELFG